MLFEFFPWQFLENNCWTIIPEIARFWFCGHDNRFGRKENIRDVVKKPPRKSGLEKRSAQIFGSRWVKTNMESWPQSLNLFDFGKNRLNNVKDNFYCWLKSWKQMKRKRQSAGFNLLTERLEWIVERHGKENNSELCNSDDDYLSDVYCNNSGIYLNCCTGFELSNCWKK